MKRSELITRIKLAHENLCCIEKDAKATKDLIEVTLSELEDL